jgi:lysophospholipase-2
MTFPDPIIFEPSSEHSHTVIMLHGRGSNGQEFAQELFEAQFLVDNENVTLRSRFPSYRWVFPSSRELWSSTFDEKMPAWFDAYSLTDISAESDLQIPGIRESICHNRKILENELTQVQNDSRRIILGGISQGAAVGYWLLLSVHEQISLGGFFAASSWLPFDSDVLKYFVAEELHDSGIKGSSVSDSKFVQSMISTPVGNINITDRTPILIGHGLDDAYVDVELGKSARDVFRKAGYVVEWTEYKGADEEGHWFKEPEQVQDIASFMGKVSRQ